MNAPRLSVIIPAYNEARRIEATLAKIVGYLLDLGIPFEIVVVDDGSSDATAELVRRAGAGLAPPAGRIRLVENDRNRGKGYCVRRGMLEAEGGLALLSDADLSTPIEEYRKLERVVAETPCDIAIGSRDVAGSQVEVHQSGVRENSGKLYNLMVRGLFGLPFRDTQCGFKLFDLKRCRGLFRKQTVDRYSFDVEILVIARIMGLRVEEVPVVWRHDAGSKVNFVRDGAKMVWDLLRIRWRTALGRYD